MPKVVYAPAIAPDIPGILTLHKECNLEPWSSGAYINSLNQPEFLIFTAKINEKLLGFISTRLITQEDLCEILNIAIAPQYQHAKIGEGLLFTLFKHLGGEINRIWLEVRENNRPAISFYEKHGFKTVGKRNNFYRNPVENALLMEKTL